MIEEKKNILPVPQGVLHERVSQRASSSEGRKKWTSTAPGVAIGQLIMHHGQKQTALLTSLCLHWGYELLEVVKSSARAESRESGHNSINWIHMHTTVPVSMGMGPSSCSNQKFVCVSLSEKMLVCSNANGRKCN